jgi:hypothetical protein
VHQLDVVSDIKDTKESVFAVLAFEDWPAPSFSPLQRL